MSDPRAPMNESLSRSLSLGGPPAPYESRPPPNPPPRLQIEKSILKPQRESLIKTKFWTFYGSDLIKLYESNIITIRTDGKFNHQLGIASLKGAYLSQEWTGSNITDTVQQAASQK